MIDKPIIFSAPMVRALLDGRKTQTRRVLRYQPDYRGGHGNMHDPEEWGWMEEDGSHFCVLDVKTPYAVGERLYVREAHTILPTTAYRGSVGTGTIAQTEHPTDGYSAAVMREGFDRSGRPRWRPSIHMPRWASRITLTVTNVRVQRIRDISEDDAVAEGIEMLRLDDEQGWKNYETNRPNRTWELPTVSFATLWNSIHGLGKFAENPWVAAYTFTVQMGNIDRLAEGEA